jgi:membrane glycosyltransferase
MEFIHHSLNWCKGEIFEGKLSLLFGLIILLVGLSYFKWGTTPYSKAMIWPLVAVAVLAIGVGMYLISTNSNRLVHYQTQFAEHPNAFVQAEKERTEAFISWYPKTQKILFVIMLVGMLGMVLSQGALFRAIGIGLMLFAIYGFVLDHFSEERAAIYHKGIIEHLKE